MLQVSLLIRRAGGRVVRVFSSTIAAAVLAAGMAPSLAAAGPSAPVFGPMIDDLGSYQSQTTCSATDKPGARAFRRFVLAQYPGTGAGAISRSCGSGGTSEHKEGRAWDWGVHADVKAEKSAADELIAWLLAPDEYENEVAMARRAGIMYLIWNRMVWSVWGGWQTYCVTKKNVGCVKPGTNQVRHPHTDHVHFSFTWAGAKKKTTFYKPDRSLVADIAPGGAGGYWIAGRNGGVVPFGAAHHGGRVGKTKRFAVVDLAPTPSGKGYYLLAADGRVSAFGDAVFRGGARQATAPAVALDLTPSGAGYLVVAADGGVVARGDAVHLGDGAGSTDDAVDLLVIEGGYRIVFASGRVAAFGAAADLGGLEGPDSPVTGAASHGDAGYWLVTASGRVTPVGTAPDFGTAEGMTGNAVSIAATRGRDGIWVVSDLGVVRALGSAPVLGDLAP